MIATGLIALTSVISAAPSFAEGDAKAGKKVFRKCKACHSLDEGKNGAGPHLANLIGRTAGSVDDFNYSDALIDSGIVWDTETLTAFLTDPKENIPGNKMAFRGLTKENDIENLLAYLAEE